MCGSSAWIKGQISLTNQQAASILGGKSIKERADEKDYNPDVVREIRQDLTKSASRLASLAAKDKRFKKAEDLVDKARKILFDLQESAAMDEGATENALGTLKAILKALKGRTDATGKDMFKMGTGMMDYYSKEKSFSPDQAKWIFKMSKMFK